MKPKSWLNFLMIVLLCAGSGLVPFSALADDCDDEDDNKEECDTEPPENATVIDPCESCEWECDEGFGPVWDPESGTYIPCGEECPDSSESGDINSHGGSIGVDISLGPGRNGRASAGKLIIYQDRPQGGLGDPASLQTWGIHKDSAETLFVGTQIRQILTPYVLMNIVGVSGTPPYQNLPETRNKVNPGTVQLFSLDGTLHAFPGVGVGFLPGPPPQTPPESDDPNLIHPLPYIPDVSSSPQSYRIDIYPSSVAQSKQAGLYVIPAGEDPIRTVHVTSKDNFSDLHLALEEDGEILKSHTITWAPSLDNTTVNRDDEVETVYSSEIFADGSYSMTPDTNLQAAFPAVPLSSNVSYTASGAFPALLEAADYTLAIDTPFGDYLTGVQTLPGSGIGTNDDYLVAAILSVTNQPVVARKTLRYFYNSNGIDKVTLTLFDMSFLNGQKKPVLVIDDPNGENLITARSYYRVPDNQNLHGKLQYQIDPTGAWTWYGYDVLGREITKLTGWMDEHDIALGPPEESLVRATKYHYETVEPRDVASIRHTRPRTTEEYIQGVLVSRTWNAYFTEVGGGEVAVEDRAATGTSQYGDPENDYTESAMYGEDAAEHLLGLPKWSLADNGLISTNIYETGSYSSGAPGTFTTGAGTDLRHIKITGTSAQPDGIPFESTQEVTIYDEFQNVLEDRREVVTSGSPELVDWSVHQYTDFGFKTNTLYANGLSTAIEPFCGCGSPVLTGTVDGRGVERTHDFNGRLLEERLLGVTGGVYADQEDRVTAYTYDSQGNILTETVSAGSLLLVTMRQYDAAGRLTNTVDAAGLVTTYAYTNGGRISTVTRPGGVTQTTENYLDGRLKSITGTGSSTAISTTA